MNRFGKQRNMGLDISCPINWQHPLNHGLVACYMVPPNPGYRGGLVLRDLVRGAKRPNDGTLTNFANPNIPTSGWTGTSRKGGYGAIAFDGVNDYIEAADSPALRLTTQGAIALWLKAGTLTQDDYAGLVAKSAGGTLATISYTLHWRQLDSVLRGQICDGGSLLNCDASLFSDTNWHHLVFAWSGSQLLLYKDAVLTTSVSQTINAQAATHPFKIGGNTYDATGEPVQYFQGSLDDIRVYNRALSAYEIRYLYDQSQKGHPNTMRWMSPRTFSFSSSPSKFNPVWARNTNIILGTGYHI